MTTIGLRFKPEHAYYREQGCYWERLPPLVSTTEIAIQKALLLPAPKRVQERIAKAQAVRGENWTGNYLETA